MTSIWFKIIEFILNFIKEIIGPLSGFLLGKARSERKEIKNELEKQKKRVDIYEQVTRISDTVDLMSGDDITRLSEKLNDRP